MGKNQAVEAVNVAITGVDADVVVFGDAADAFGDGVGDGLLAGGWGGDYWGAGQAWQDWFGDGGSPVLLGGDHWGGILTRGGDFLAQITLKRVEIGLVRHKRLGIRGGQIGGAKRDTGQTEQKCQK